MWGDAEWVNRKEQEEARRVALYEQQWSRGTELEQLLKDAETDLEAFRLVELARLIEPGCFTTRETMFEHVQRMRSGPSGNDPAYQDAIEAFQRTARLAVEPAIRKAQEVLGLVRSWA